MMVATVRCEQKHEHRPADHGARILNKCKTYSIKVKSARLVETVSFSTGPSQLLPPTSVKR